MSKQEHTPLPWAAVTPCPGECCWHVVEAALVTEETTWEDWVNVPEMSEADAKLIVKCVNSHDELLSIAQRWVALDGSAWHVTRHAIEKTELLADTRAAVSRALDAPPQGEK